MEKYDDTKCSTNEAVYLSRDGWEHGKDERVEQEVRVSEFSEYTLCEVWVVFLFIGFCSFL